MPDASSVPPKKFYDFHEPEVTVGKLISILKSFPRDSAVSFQFKDEMDSPILRPVTVEHDSLWEITDIVFEEWTE